MAPGYCYFRTPDQRRVVHNYTRFMMGWGCGIVIISSVLMAKYGGHRTILVHFTESPPSRTENVSKSVIGGCSAGIVWGVINMIVAAFGMAATHNEQKVRNYDDRTVWLTSRFYLLKRIEYWLSQFGVCGMFAGMMYLASAWTRNDPWPYIVGAGCLVFAVVHPIFFRMISNYCIRYGLESQGTFDGKLPITSSRDAVQQDAAKHIVAAKLRVAERDRQRGSGASGISYPHDHDHSAKHVSLEYPPASASEYMESGAAEKELDLEKGSAR